MPPVVFWLRGAAIAAVNVLVVAAGGWLLDWSALRTATWIGVVTVTGAVVHLLAFRSYLRGRRSLSAAAVSLTPSRDSRTPR